MAVMILLYILRCSLLSSPYSQALFFDEAVYTAEVSGEPSGSAGSREGRGGAYGGGLNPMAQDQTTKGSSHLRDP